MTRNESHIEDYIEESQENAKMQKSLISYYILVNFLFLVSLPIINQIAISALSIPETRITNMILIMYLVFVGLSPVVTYVIGTIFYSTDEDEFWEEYDL